MVVEMDGTVSGLDDGDEDPRLGGTGDDVLFDSEDSEYSSKVTAVVALAIEHAWAVEAGKALEGVGAVANCAYRQPASGGR